MGGDYGPPVTVPAALAVLKQQSDVHLILVGDEPKLQQQLKISHASSSACLSIRHASQVVAMDELPSSALRSKKDSSLRVAINLVKEGVAQACVSAGNTGALMATARFVLKTLPGVDRPAIVTALPTSKPNTIVRVLDLGANVDSSAEHLFQFAVMGTALVTAVDGKEKPTVGLLNIGVEEIKGNEQVKRTAQLLSESEVINYIGYVEGDDIFTGVADLVVCDGFVGNVALKSGEGMAKLISFLMKQNFRKNCWTRLAGLLVLPVLRNLSKSIDPARYNGASLLGLQGIVIKSHGGTNIIGFATAIFEALSEIQHNVPQRISEQVASLLQESAT